MRKASVAFTLAAAGGLWLGCSNSTGPGDTLAGRWHVAIGPIGSGNLSPSTLDFVVKTSGNSFTVTLPALTWSIGPVVYDSTPTIATFSDTTYFGFRIAPSTPSEHCDQVLMYGQKNAGQDTLLSATVAVYHADTVAGGMCGTPQAQGSITAHK